MLGHAPPEKNEKNDVILCNLGVQKYVITNVKITILMVINQQQQNLFTIFPSPFKEDVYVCSKINTFRVLKGGLGPRSRRNFKNIKQNGGFSFITFCFFAGLPKSPKL